MGQRISTESPWRRVRRTVTSTNPAAGVAPSVTVPAGSLYDVVGVLASLVTDATVANRLPRLVVTDGNVTILDIAAPAVQAASLTTRYQWLEGGVAYGVTGSAVAPLPDLQLQEGWTLSLATDNLQAADDWTALTLLVIETTIRGGPASLAMAPDLVVEVQGLASS